jgi:hypothetical protein
LQEFSFKVIYKRGKVHFVPDELSHVKHGELAVAMENQLHDIVIFLLIID